MFCCLLWKCIVCCIGCCLEILRATYNISIIILNLIRCLGGNRKFWRRHIILPAHEKILLDSCLSFSVGLFVCMSVELWSPPFNMVLNINRFHFALYFLPHQWLLFPFFCYAFIGLMVQNTRTCADKICRQRQRFISRQNTVPSPSRKIRETGCDRRGGGGDKKRRVFGLRLIL